MDAALQTCRERGWREVFLVSNSALTPALALYRSVGFTEVPLPKTKDYVRTDVMMELRW